MSTKLLARLHDSPTRRSPDVGHAWAALLLFPLVFAGAFLIGEGLISLLGYEVGGAVRPPWWAGTIATVPALALFWFPAILATRAARRASREHDRRGWIPAGLAIALCTAFTILNTVPLGR